MQEKILSLMQMPRTTIAVQTAGSEEALHRRFDQPTTDGVSASYAMLGDVHVAEPAR